MKTIQKTIEDSLVKINRPSDLKNLIEKIKDKRVVMLGEASHGTLEYYQTRAEISKRLIEDYGFNFIAVEGDWPDAFRLHKYITANEGKSAKQVLMKNHRWPTWMWANDEVVQLAEWMKGRSAGFFGLDVYSIFESIDEVLKYLNKTHPALAAEFQNRYSCFDSFERDEMSYAKSLMKFPEGCEKQVTENLQRLLSLRLSTISKHADELFNAQQNAHIVDGAESYYRAMLGGDANSWNIRDGHMIETLDRLLDKHGPNSKAIVWAHNTHIGDYRATDMKVAGYVNIGGLARQSYGSKNVALVGFGSYHGQVLAGAAWGSPEKIMPLPDAVPGSYEFYLHLAAHKKNAPKFSLDLTDQIEGPLTEQLGHRAIGVVYNPKHEHRGNYVPTELAHRYDHFIFIDRTTALKSLHNIPVVGEFPETWPSGM
jgi:erythromycin esterase